VSLGLQAGGLGLALGGEIALSRAFSLAGELQYMDLADAGIALATLHAGPRFYFAQRAIGGFFAGAYALGLAGWVSGERDLAAGVLLELGYAWLPRALPGFLVEPYVKYPWLGGEEPLAGIAPGLSIGWAFGPRGPY